jgi:hypothetical protein
MPLAIAEDPSNSDGFYRKPFTIAKDPCNPRKNIVEIPNPYVI